MTGALFFVQRVGAPLFGGWTFDTERPNEVGAERFHRELKTQMQSGRTAVRAIVLRGPSYNYSVPLAARFQRFQIAGELRPGVLQNPPNMLQLRVAVFFEQTAGARKRQIPLTVKLHAVPPIGCPAYLPVHALYYSPLVAGGCELVHSTAGKFAA
jgi:hypothetical protein